MIDLVGECRYQLDSRAACADDPDTFRPQVDAPVRPVAGVIPVAGEIGQAGYIGHRGARKAAGGEDAVPGGHGVALVGHYVPAQGVLVQYRPGHVATEGEMAPQIEPVGDVVQIGQDLGLRGEAFGPVPFLFELVGEGVRIVDALYVTAATRVTIPEPGSPDPRTCLESPNRQSLGPQPVDHVEAGDAGSHHDNVDVVTCL